MSASCVLPERGFINCMQWVFVEKIRRSYRTSKVRQPILASLSSDAGIKASCLHLNSNTATPHQLEVSASPGTGRYRSDAADTQSMPTTHEVEFDRRRGFIMG